MTTAQTPSERAPAPASRRVDDPAFQARVDALLTECGADPASTIGRNLRDVILTSLKLITDNRDSGEIRLMTAAFKELRYAYSVFADYADPYKVTIFGSARTKEDHPDYKTTVDFSRCMAENGWLCITGAGDGIMKAGHEGPGRDASFGLAIRLPFETSANEVIRGDPKLINFRYFFTRKLMFVSQCEAVVVMPGGFGTQDELFEALTLIQTGKSSMVPVVLLEAEGGTYWKHWDNYVRRSLLETGMISADDLNLYHITRDVQDAVDHITRYYRNFHSYRYVKDDLIIRIRKPLEPGDVERLNVEFAGLVREGTIKPCKPYDVEEDHLELPRLAFTHNRRHFGVFRRMIDRINEFDPVDTAPLHPTEIY